MWKQEKGHILLTLESLKDSDLDPSVAIPQQATLGNFKVGVKSIFRQCNM